MLISGVFAGLFCVAFGAGWLVPLFVVAKDSTGEDFEVSSSAVILDIFAVLLDWIPMFWLLDNLVSTARSEESREAIIHEWRSNSSLRFCFFSWLVCGSVLFCLLAYFFLTQF